jgi:hypothetical protein
MHSPKSTLGGDLVADLRQLRNAVALKTTI